MKPPLDRIGWGRKGVDVKLDITPGAIRDLVITEIAVDPTNDNVTFSFQAKVRQVYIVERSTSLLPTGQPGGWLEIEDFL